MAISIVPMSCLLLSGLLLSVCLSVCLSVNDVLNNLQNPKPFHIIRAHTNKFCNFLPDALNKFTSLQQNVFFVD